MFHQSAISRRILSVSPAVRYAVAIGAAAAAVLLRVALEPVWGLNLPFITLFPAIMLSAWMGGLWPGILATAITAVAAEYYWIGSGRSWGMTDPTELLGLTVFAAIGGLISALNEAWRRGTASLAESEERLNVTLTSIGDAVITTDEHGSVTRLNAVAEALTGWAGADAAGRPLHDVFVIIDEESRQPAGSPVERVLREGVTTGLANHTVLVAKDGRESPIDDSAAPIRTTDGRMAGVVMVFRDVTERRLAERERAVLLDAERTARRDAETAGQQLQAALQAGRMGTWQYTIATGEVKWSTGLEVIHGYAPGAFAGTFEAFRDEIHPADRDRVQEAIATALEHGRDHHVEYRIVRTDGAIRWVEGLGQVVCDEQGSRACMIGVCTDVTERKELEHARTQLLEREQTARADIERASKLKDEFLAVLSHELRTPLNAVIGYAHLLSSGALPPNRVSHALDAIRRNAQAQARLVESLLDLSRVMAGKLELDLEELNLTAVVTAAADVIRPEAMGKNIGIDIVVPAIPLIGDATRLQQVFWNLLSNAVKFTARGGRIGIRCVEEDAQIRVMVSDNGEGIAAEFLPYVFDRFSQADGAKRRSLPGLGLGLALVREMVQAHGGTVAADSPGQGRGSTITVTLPLPAAAFPPASKQSAPSRVDAPEWLPRIEILIVDDDGDVRDLLALLLESRGAIVRTVSSANEALEAISHRRPDLLLADLRMPDEDGYSLIRKVRARERERYERRLPAIAVTAYASASDRDQAVAAGYDSHLPKPVDPRDLARAVAHVARRVQREKEAL